MESEVKAIPDDTIKNAHFREIPFRERNMKFHRARSSFHFRKLLDSFSVFLDTLSGYSTSDTVSLDTSLEIRIHLLSRD